MRIQNLAHLRVSPPCVAAATIREHHQHGSTFFLTGVANQYYRRGALYLALVALDEDDRAISDRGLGADSGDWSVGCESGTFFPTATSFRHLTETTSSSTHIED